MNQVPADLPKGQLPGTLTAHPEASAGTALGTSPQFSRRETGCEATEHLLFLRYLELPRDAGNMKLIFIQRLRHLEHNKGGLPPLPGILQPGQDLDTTGPEGQGPWQGLHAVWGEWAFQLHLCCVAGTWAPAGASGGWESGQGCAQLRSGDGEAADPPGRLGQGQGQAPAPGGPPWQPALWVRVQMATSCRLLGDPGQVAQPANGSDTRATPRGRRGLPDESGSPWPLCLSPSRRERIRQPPKGPPAQRPCRDCWAGATFDLGPGSFEV